MSMKHLTTGLALTACMAINAPAQAQEITDPLLLRAYEEIRAMGPTMGPDVVQRTGELFAELHRHTPKDGVSATRDLQYGPDSERHLLDVYTPQGATGTRPAVVYIHGGGLTGGHKDNSASDLMYANIGTYFARNHMVGINATYRLVPNIVYPQGAEDMKMIVAWIRENAANYGIDPEQVFFFCASAGCTHVGSPLFDTEMMFDATPDIAGAIMMSGAYEAGNEAYFGSDAAVRETRSVMSLAARYQGAHVPVFLMSAEFDPIGIELGTARLYNLLCETRQRCPRFTQIMHQNHYSENQHINTQDDFAGSQMLDFIRKVVDGQHL